MKNIYNCCNVGVMVTPSGRYSSSFRTQDTVGVGMGNSPNSFAQQELAFSLLQVLDGLRPSMQFIEQFLYNVGFSL